MTATEWSYLLTWTVLALVLVATGGLGLLLAPFALACGAHRAHVPRAVEGWRQRRTV